MHLKTTTRRRFVGVTALAASRQLRNRAVTAGPGGLHGPELEYWKIGGVWK